MTPLDLDAVKEMQRAVMALVYEVPEQVWADVRERWNAVVDEVERLRAENERLKKENRADA